MIRLVPTRTFRYLLPLAPFLWFYLVTGLGAIAALELVLAESGFGKVGAGVAAFQRSYAGK